MEERFAHTASSGRCRRPTGSRRCCPRARASCGTITARRRASGWRTSAGGGSRCCPACRARCAACLRDTLLPLHPRAARRRATRGALAHAAHHRCRESRSSPIGWARWRAASATPASRICPNAEGTDLRLTVRSASRTTPTVGSPRRRSGCAAIVGDVVYGEDGADLAAVVLDLCRARGLTIGVAESCTGGLLGARLTAIAGTSDVVLGGVIAYQNAIKSSLLGVDPPLIVEHGAVSEPVVRAMAAGARTSTGARAWAGDHRHRRTRRRKRGEAGRHRVDRDRHRWRGGLPACSG